MDHPPARRSRRKFSLRRSARHHEQPAAPPAIRRSRLHRRVLLIAAVIVTGAAFAAAPRIVEVPPVRRLALALANRALAPSRVELTSLRLSWIGSTRMTGLVLRDRRGKAVVAAPRATLDRNLRQLLFDRPRYGTLTLHEATADIERRGDGVIDLAEALDPILASDPKKPSDPATDFTLKIVRGTLRVRAPELAEPMKAERMDLTLKAPAAPAKLSWTIALANPSAAGGEGLDIAGHFDHRAGAGAPPALALSLSGRRWPVAASGAGVVARGRFHGKVELRQEAGRRTLAGDAQMLGFDAAGPALAGDRLWLDRVGGAWDLAEASGAWTVRRLDLSSSVGSVKAEGTLTATPGATTRIEARLDLAALARQLPHALRLREGLTLERGQAQLRADLRAEGTGQALDVEARVSDLVARDASRTITLGDPATLSAHLTRQAGRIVVERVAGRAAFFDLSGSGDLDRGVSLTGTFDLGGLQAQLRDLIDFGGIGLAGRAQLTASYRRAGTAYAGKLSADFRDLNLAGAAAEPLHRDRLLLDLAAEGPAGETGLPGGWQAVRLGLKTDDLAADLTANRREAVIALTAGASGPLHLAGRDGRAEGRLAGSWTGQALQIDEVRVGLHPVAPAAPGAQDPGAQATQAMQLRIGPPSVDPVAEAGSLALAARGRFDMAKGELLLGPLPGAAPGAIALEAEGLRLSGLGRSGEPLQGAIGLVGDLARIDRTLAAWTGGPAAGLAGTGSVQLTARRGPDGGLHLVGTVGARGLSVASAAGMILERTGVRIQADLATGREGQILDIEARVAEVVTTGVRPIAVKDPGTVTARLIGTAGAFAVERVEIKTTFLAATGTGDLDRGVKLTGTIDLAKLRTQLGDLVNVKGFDMAGRGGLAADYHLADASFKGRLAVEFREMSVTGLTAEPVRREAVRFDATVGGPATASGLPSGWTSARLGLKSGTVSAGLAAAPRDAAIALDAAVAGSLPLAGGTDRGEARLKGRWAAPTLEIDSLRAALQPSDPRAQAGSIALVARGRFDTAKGDLVLEPIQPGEPGSIAPLPEGLRVSGLGGAGTGLKVEGGLSGDLAALDGVMATWTSGMPSGVAGALVARVSTRRDPDGLLHVDSRLESPDLSIPAEGGGRRTEGPASLVARGTYRAEGDRIDLTELVLSCRYGSLNASGSLVEPNGRLLADLRGTATPDWVVVNALLASSVELGARLQGSVRPFHVRGPLAGGPAVEILRGLDAELGIDLSEAQAFGLRIGPAPIVARCGGGKVAIEPIATTLNGGRVDLKPEILLDDPRGVILRLAPGAAITDAEIDDEVSRRVLAYVAPILHEATQVRGRLSAAFDRAEFPIAGATGRAAAEGRIIFGEVVFGPGPLGQQLLGLVGQGATPSLRLNRTVSITIADGRVTQSGLAIDVSPQVQIALDGSVGFDGTLALRAGVPITATMLGNQQLIGQVVDGTRVGVPIGGTLSRPGIDQRALQVALRDAGRSMLRRGAEAGAAGLLQRLAPQEARGGAGAEAGAAGLLQRLAPQEARGGAGAPAPTPSRRPGGSSLPEEALRFLRP